MSKNTEELRDKLSKHGFESMKEAASPTTVKVIWYLGDAVDEIMPYIDQYVSQKVIEGRIDEVDKGLTYKEGFAHTDHNLVQELQYRRIKLEGELKAQLTRKEK